MSISDSQNWECSTAGPSTTINDSDSESTSSTSSLLYESDEVITCCDSGSDSPNDGMDKDQKEICGFNPVTLTEKEEHDILNIFNQEIHCPQYYGVYPELVGDDLKKAYKDIYENLRTMSQPGWVFVAMSDMQLIGQGNPRRPRHVLCDVCCVRPTEPLTVLTFTTIKSMESTTSKSKENTTDKTEESKCVRYNTKLTRLIIEHLEADLKQSLRAVYGVFTESNCVSSEEFGNKVTALETSARKKFLPQSLHMNKEKQKIVTYSLLKLFRSQGLLYNKTEEVQHEEDQSISDDDKCLTLRSKSGAKMQVNDNKEIAKMKEIINGLVEKNRQLQIENEELKCITTTPGGMSWGPRRKCQWTDDEVMRLRDVVCKRRVDSEGNTAHMKILMFGPSGHGKSSLCNGFRSAMKGDKLPSTYHHVQSSSESVTNGFQGSIYEDIWIFDMPGIQESNLTTSLSIEDIISGRVPFSEKIKKSLEVINKDSMEVPKHGSNDVSCVVIVLRYNAHLGPELKRQIGVIFELAGKGVTSYQLVLTYLDECDGKFSNTSDLPLMYDSSEVQTAVQRWSSELGIPMNAISFVKNYAKETETDTNTSIHHLRVLERVVYSSLQQIDKKIDQKRQKELYKDDKEAVRIPTSSIKRHAKEHALMDISRNILISAVTLLLAVSLLWFERYQT